VAVLVGTGLVVNVIGVVQNGAPEVGWKYIAQVFGCKAK